MYIKPDSCKTKSRILSKKIVALFSVYIWRITGKQEFE